ncbi:MAG TPA: protein-L-isoaspartate(D-aspartate) O-methyltransferase [Thermoleophilia bacterium]|nr:protein-L-isoaspartate(D-aspartate) O-methyltransferase [Thermoleophilia bacterium]
MTVGQETEHAQTERRHLMVADQLETRGIRDGDVLSAMRTVPRHLFMPDELWDQAYHDGALPIGHGQTISQPFMVALMTQLLAPTVRSTVLEVGTGSGYQAAVLAELAGHVYTVERVEALAEQAGEILARLGYHNVTIVVGDGSLGLPDHAPYDRIMVTAAAPQAPPPLLDQLAAGGRLVVPVGPAGRDQVLHVIERTADGLREVESVPCRFVPLLGESGFQVEGGPAGLGL